MPSESLHEKVICKFNTESSFLNLKGTYLQLLRLLVLFLRVASRTDAYKSYIFEMQLLTPPVPIPDKEKKLS